MFVSTTFHLPDKVVDAMAQHPMWKVSVELAPMLPHELDEVGAADVPDPSHATPPTRVLVAAEGGNPAFGVIAARLHDTMGCEIVRIPGVPHFAMASEPDVFAAAALAHFDQVHDVQ